MGLWRTMGLACVAAAALALAGCTNDAGNAETPTPTPTPTQTFAAPDQVCPEQLPVSQEGVDDGWDFATELPDLPAADAAWLCQYTASSPPTEGSQSEDMVWSLEAGPVELPAAGLDAVSRMASGFTVFTQDLFCTLDFGPRWLVAFQAGEELFGVTVDDYGCHKARLTDDPFSVAPGHSDDPRLVQGSLGVPPGILEDLKAAAGLD